MIETVMTRVGRLSVSNTNLDDIQLVSRYDGAAGTQTHTHYLTIEQLTYLVAALERTIDIKSPLTRFYRD
jgi:hypothetical protein